MPKSMIFISSKMHCSFPSAELTDANPMFTLNDMGFTFPIVQRSTQDIGNYKYYNSYSNSSSGEGGYGYCSSSISSSNSSQISSS